MLEMTFPFESLPGMPELSEELREQLQSSVTNVSAMLRTIVITDFIDFHEEMLSAEIKGFVIGVYWRASTGTMLFRTQLKDKFAAFLVAETVPITFWPVLRKTKKIYSIVGGVIVPKGLVPESVVLGARRKKAQNKIPEVLKCPEVSKFLLTQEV